MNKVLLPNDQLAKSRAKSPFAVATYAMLSTGLLAAYVLGGQQPHVFLFVSAILFGWSEVDGLCGRSHVGTLTPLRVYDPTHKLWLKSVSAYTAGGIVTSALVGATLGLLGRYLTQYESFIYLFTSGLALTLAFRELRWITFRLPQVHRQTQKMWAFEYGFVPGAMMWGAHIGLGFATVISHGGFYVVVASAAMFGPAHGAALLSTYWVGRALPMWIAPLLDSREDGASWPELILASQNAYRHIAAVGLLLSGVAAISLAVLSSGAPTAQ